MENPPKRPKTPSLPPAVRIAKIAEVQRFLMDGHPSWSVHKETKSWGLSSRTIDQYIIEAKELIQSYNDASVKEYQATIINNLWEIFREARKFKNFELMRKTLKDIASVKGINTLRVTHAVEERVIEHQKLSDEDLEKAFNSAIEVPNDGSPTEAE